MIPRNRKGCKLDFTQEVVWERVYLKKKCKEVGVEKEYILYEKRLRCNSIGVFIFLHSAVTLIHCFLLLMTCQDTTIIQIDIISYIGAALLIITVLSINFNEEIIRKHSWIMYASSVIAASVMVMVDLMLHIYHMSDHWNVGSFYDTYVIYSIYLFMPIPFIKGPLILGVSVSLSYITYFFAILDAKHLYQMKNVFQFNQMAVDVVHYICFNMLGLFFRLMSDIIVRSSFLDRQQYVMEEIGLRSARKQEQLLLHSILPPQIARPFQEDIRSRVAAAGKRRGHRTHNVKERIMAIQNHPEVSILYADVVNYTHLTTTLTVNELVTLLHDLYGRFDVAASHFKVQRIKFLGDCYYCVAGLSRPDPDHAKCCIDLGHCMIAHIREVRLNRNLNIDMRIGVHSGSLLAGVIGATKLQYDIWGNDVKIASKLEATGRPGHIHISERTLGSILDNTYEILPGTEEALNDPYLASHNIHTFLIAAINVKLEDYGLKGAESHSYMQLAEEERSSSIKRELQAEYGKLPVGAFHIIDFIRFWKKTKKKPQNTNNSSRPIVDFFFLHFRDPRLEYNYMRQPDYMLKYSVLLAWFIGISLIYIQIVYHDRGNLYYYVDGIVFITMTVPLFITWFKKMCYWRYKKDSHEFSKWTCKIFRIAEFMQRNLIIRLCIYMSTVIAYFGVITVVLVDCDQEEFQVRHIENKLYHYEPDLFICFHPWVLTNMACLMIGMSVIFTRIPWMVKIIVSVLEGLTYVIIMFFQFEYIIHHSKTTNPYFSSEYAHTYIIGITIVSFYLMERQAEFNSKVNYNWRLELLKKQQDAVITNKSITILLQNILPAHVVNIYLTSLASHELYYEDYEMVAVMFASLQNFVLDLANLRVLNEIITEFDKILYYYRKDYLVEKIKIVGCTYMAACGLDLRFSGRIDGQDDNSIIKEVTRAQRFLAAFEKQSAVPGVRNEVVFVLTTFALDLLRTLWMCRNVYEKLPIDRGVFSADMSIGISCGEVMAGVVGASQVHYDIWGNPVNMASRMDSTGVSGRIHITEETAVILRAYGIECDYRGMTFVKGRGVLPTYFVGIDENYEFKNTPEFNSRPPVNPLKRMRQNNDDTDEMDP
ncbi:adenylyl cyclase X E-like isoform X1 [Drosophila montana]|uniref:adenylyl cyclase X E-like isoform X1 n=2 Tax=Drosophila montana TaxID=40370 RepID=UPI00313B796F